ncbi:MarR family winged helix-turn-helix transcriptional regulator [Actinomycetospora chiangmaiensis]|uniref:MarR family winged helix-turn-helix transcriptional regulator n=1 Tax=Actinomycetospora chiangmaiensis TaxID=402650 RepID=UPI00036EB8F0|nr:MarR family transcriptional regulator [Actinomycetospora chiangmaiensis]
MAGDETARLFKLADRILAVGRLIHAAKDPAFAGQSWTPLESAVMRVIDREPGVTAGAAAAATQLVSSNFSRALRGLERKGLVRRVPDPADARRVHLHPTDRAHANLRELQRIWSDLLTGIITDPAELDTVVEVLRRIETELADRRARPGRTATEEST